MADSTQTTRFRFWRWLIRFIGVIVPQRFRARFRQEWEAELEYREEMLARWDRLDWRNKLELLWRSLGAFWDALWLQRQRWEDEMIQDLRFGFRMLLKNPGFTAVAVLTLALGIGANTAIFSVINGVLLRPLPFHEPGRLAMLWTDDLKRNLREVATAYPNFLDWRNQSQSFADMAIFSGNPLVLIDAEEPERILGSFVSANLFPLLGVAPALGRGITPSEEEGGERVVVLSHQLWQRRFGGASDVIGKSIKIDGDANSRKNGPRAARVIGVMPPGFYFPN
ncbi:MAG TPA: ABC transporter permease, partial [Blastocatellia bacterium]|nr:ABC transporter permease [Blastocatellia bacterium]